MGLFIGSGKSVLRSMFARIVLFSLILLGLFLAPGLLSAHAALVRVPGVKPGDTAIYAQTVGRWNLPGPPPPTFGQFINLNFTTLSVTSVTGSNVSASQTFHYVNGTVRDDIIQGGVDTDSGNITFWLTAANLTAGTPLYTTPNSPVINSTLTLVFAGAPRSINVYNATISFPGGTEFVNAWWDKLTGILVHVDFAIKTPTGNAFAGAQLVQTSLWNPAPSPGIGLFALPTPLLIAQGFSNTSQVHLISERGFSGGVIVNALIPGCVSGCPNVTVVPGTQFLSTGSQDVSVLNVSTTFGTGLGSYGVLVTARMVSSPSTIANSTVVNVTVVPSAFDESPTAVISFSPASPVVGQAVVFSPAGSFDPDGIIVSYIWNFGDFSTIISQNNTSVIHAYATVNTFTVKLTVVDNSSRSGVAFAIVNVVANQTDEPPIADFVVRVSNSSLPIRVGQLVTFDASSSFDPDGFISNYSWNFGDGGLIEAGGPLHGHVYSSPGNYTVSLVVTDSSGKTASVRHSVLVAPAVLHDVGIVNVEPEPTTVVSGQNVFVGVYLVNLGQQPENVDITVRFNSQVAATLHGFNLPVTGPFGFFTQLTWDTTDIAPGNYTISASVFLATDQNLSNNQFTDGQVTVLPPPVLTVSPSQGAVGTQVSVHGSGFPVANGQFQFSISVEVTFDNQFIGIQTLDSKGSFDFVFNIPVAQANVPHTIHALEEIFPSPIEASTGFSVVPGPGTLSLTVSVGAIYFPGDTAVVYVLSTANGSPAAAGTVSLSLMLPNGTSRSLALVSVSMGVYRASYVVPAKNSLGTYGLIATSHLSGAIASAFGSFEVKPTWLQSNARNLVTGTAVVGAVGFMALAWRKGFFSRRKDEFPIG